jgi:hypothetical protein
MDTQYNEVKKEYNGKKMLYQKAVKGKTMVETLISQLQCELNNTQGVVLRFVAEMQRGIQRLSEISLKKDPLQQGIISIFLFNQKKCKLNLVTKSV